MMNPGQADMMRQTPEYLTILSEMQSQSGDSKVACSDNGQQVL
jgi:hypothetical protein